MKTRMIDRSEYRRVGVILRTHGKEGGLLVSWETIENPFDNDALRFVFLDLEGRFIPFFITAHEPGPGDREIIYLEDINTPEEAALYTGTAYYLHERYLEDIQEPFMGLEPGKFRVVDVKFGEIGLAMAIGGTKENPLLEVKKGDREILIPLNADYIVELDEKKAVITIDIPEDLLHLN